MGLPSYIVDAPMALKKDLRLCQFRTAFAEEFVSAMISKSSLDSPVFHSLVKVLQHGIHLLEDRLVMMRAYLQAESTEDSWLLEEDIMESEDLLMRDFMAILSDRVERRQDFREETENNRAGHQSVRRVLKLHHRDLVSRLDTERTTVLDALASNGVITESDEETINLGDSRPDKNRRLLRVLSTAPPHKNMTCFVDFLRDNHEDIAERFEDSMKEMNSERSDDLCPACTVITELDPSRIAKTMHERGHLPDNFYEDLLNPSTMNEIKWNMIKERGLDKQAISALYPKFQHYHDLFAQGSDLTCTCVDQDCISLVQEYDGHMPEDVGSFVNSSGFHSYASTPWKTSFQRWSTKTSETVDLIALKEQISSLSHSVNDIRRRVCDTEPERREVHRYSYQDSWNIPRTMSSPVLFNRYSRDGHSDMDRRVTDMNDTGRVLRVCEPATKKYENNPHFPTTPVLYPPYSSTDVGEVYVPEDMTYVSRRLWRSHWRPRQDSSYEENKVTKRRNIFGRIKRKFAKMNFG